MPLDKFKVVHQPDEYMVCEKCGYVSPFDFCPKCFKPSNYFNRKKVIERDQNKNTK